MDLRFRGDEVNWKICAHLEKSIRPSADAWAANRSIDLRAGSLHHLRPFFTLDTNVSRELPRRTAGGFRALAEKFFAGIGTLQPFIDLGVDPGDDTRRCSRGREHAEPGACLEAGESAFVDGRDVG